MTSYEFDWSVVSQYGSWLLTGVVLTITLSVVSMAIAMVAGLLLAFMRMSKVWLIRSIASLYISVFRAVPLLVFIIWAYYGLTMVTGLNMEAFWSGVMCLAVAYAAWLAEIYRSGLQAIDKGQSEAALSTGLSRTTTFLRVIWPQAWRIIIPPMGNMFVGMLKDSSLVSVIGVGELMREGQLAVSLTFRPFEVYTAVAVIYICLTLAISRGASILEKRSGRSLQVGQRRLFRAPFSLRSAA
jgi:His/Glu/Gln/Arg/opine family amino acid ABC transporter permease subunit